jgi:16S rRNA (cytidine1402-2'-O)-methyltransferase
LGARGVVIARELTKLYEEFLRGPAAEVRAQLAARPAIKGEITLLIGKASEHETEDGTPIEEAVRALEQQGLSRMDAIKQVAKARGISKRECYKQVPKHFPESSV